MGDEAESSGTPCDSAGMGEDSKRSPKASKASKALPLDRRSLSLGPLPATSQYLAFGTRASARDWHTPDPAAAGIPLAHAASARVIPATITGVPVGGLRDEADGGECWNSEEGEAEVVGVVAVASGVLPSAAKRRALSKLLSKLQDSDIEAEESAALAQSQARPSCSGLPPLPPRCQGANTTRGPAGKIVPLRRSVGSGLSISSSWERDVAEEEAQLGHTLLEYAECASKEHLSQSVFEAQLYLVAAEQASLEQEAAPYGQAKEQKGVFHQSSTKRSTRLTAVGQTVAERASTGLADTYSSLKAIGGAFNGWRVKRVVKSAPNH